MVSLTRLHVLAHRPTLPRGTHVGVRPSRPHVQEQPSRQGGFTLVEIMVVLVIMAIIAAISIAAYFAAFERARTAATRGLILKLDRGLHDHLTTWNQASPPAISVIDRTLAGGDNERASVIARKRIYKESFPQFFSVFDTTTDPPNPVFVGDWDPLALDLDGDGVYETLQPPEDLSGPAREFRRYILGRHREELSAGRPGLANHSPETASAECLFMILRRAARAGTTEVDPENFKLSEIEDTDQDGLPELIDGWGQPIRFYRWPIGYHSPIQRGTLRYATQETREDDDYDQNRSLVLQSWWGNFLPPDATNALRFGFEFAISTRNGVPSSPFSPAAFHSLTDPFVPSVVFPGDPTAAWNAGSNPTYGQWARAYRALPLIVSAGSDGSFGLYNPFLEHPPLIISGNAAIDAGLSRVARSSAHQIKIFAPFASLASDEQVRADLDSYLDNVTNHTLSEN